VNKGVEAMGNEPLLAPLVSPDELSLVLGDERVRIFDATVFLVREVHGGPYKSQSGRAHYEEAQLPGASFAVQAVNEGSNNSSPTTVPG
jgi:3-mercaptopyruvate sulfurtransferase SseA